MNFIIAADKAVNAALEIMRVTFISKLFWLISLTVYIVIAATLIHFFILKPKLYNAKSLKQLAKKLKNKYALVLLATYVKIYVVLEIIKHLVVRIRPNGELLSFPSRHTAFAFFIAYAFPTKDKRAKTALYIWAVLVAFSRLILAKHWFSDVIFGAGFGLLTAVGFRFLAKRLK